MPQERTGLRGRSAELAAVAAALGGDRATVTVLRAAAGAGRTALLAEAVRTLPRVLWVSCAAAEPPGRYGVAAVLRTVRDRFELLGDPGLARSLKSVARLRELAAPEPEKWVAALFAEIGVLFERLGRLGHAVLVLDDAHLIEEPGPLLEAARWAGIRLLVSCRADAEPDAGTAELLAVADTVLDLPPLPDADVTALIGRVRGQRLDATVLDALRTALGPLYGNPGTALATVSTMDSEGLLAEVHGALCLRVPAASIPLPPEHELLRRCAALGPAATALLAATAALRDIRVDELPLIAGALGHDVVHCGRALDRLVRDGILVLDQGDRVRCCCPALAAAALSTPGERERLHARVAARLLADARAGQPVDEVALAEHIAAADPALTLDDAALDWLLELAAAAEAEHPERAARWYATALSRLSPQSPHHTRTLSVLLDVAMRTAQYHLLEEVLAQPGLIRPDGASTPQLRSAAVLVTMHGGTPLPAEIAGLLDGPPMAGETLRFARWWFDGEPAGWFSEDEPAPPDVRRVGVRQVASADHSLLLRSALSGELDACRSAWQRLGRGADADGLGRLFEAAGLLDIASVFELVFCAHYRVAPSGILSGYRRVVRGYLDGDWSGALSAARELQLTGTRDTVLHHAARLLAAEICELRGEQARAAGWFAEAAPLPALEGLRAWVELGRSFLAGRREDAVRSARRTYLRLRPGRTFAGLDRLLLRVAGCSLLLGADGAVHDELDRLCHKHDGGGAGEVAGLAHALLHRDPAAAGTAVALVHARGDRPAQLEGCLAMTMIADDPRPWAAEALEVAGRCAANRMRRSARNLIRERGITAPRTRAPRDPFTARETRIIALLRDGMTNRQIAAELQISEKTVEKRLTLLFARTGCRSRVELVAASVAGSLTVVAS